MKIKIAVAWFLLFILGLCAHAWAGGLSVSQERLDLGNLKEGVAAKRTVILKNSGPDQIKIANVTTSCSCTTTKLGRTELKPGQSTELTITYNTWKFPGKFEKYVTLFSGAQGKERKVITLVGYVDPVPMGVLTVKPRKLAVGELPLGKTTEKELVMQNTGNAPLSISKVVSKKFKTVYFDAKTTGSQITIKPGGRAALKLGLKPSQAGRYLDYVMIHGEARNITEGGYKVVLLGKVK
jgi:hypothetical protein